MTATGHQSLVWLLNQAPVVLCATVAAVFVAKLYVTIGDAAERAPEAA